MLNPTAIGGSGKVEVGDACSSESSYFGMGEVSRPSGLECHDNRDHLGVPLSASSFYRPASGRRDEPEGCGTDFPILARLARKGGCQIISVR